jgi:Peptidase family M28
VWIRPPPLRRFRVSAFTGAGGVSGRIGAIDGDQPIAWTRIAPNGEAALRKMRDGSRHRAIVAVTMGGEPGLCPVNAGWFSEPFGPPVLQVASERLAAFETASASSLEIRVVAHVTRQSAQAFNVISEIRGADPALPPVCVMTPRSGWHANASERGGGLACWLETMRAVVAARPRRTVKFVASSGHELGHLGLHNYLTRNPTLARDVYAWVHLGANIGTSTGDTGMTPSDDRLRAAALGAFAPHGLDQIRQSPVTQVAGEAATIKEQGGHFVSFIGRNDWFHNPGDLWPDAVDIQAVARFARAVADLTLSLANTPAV